jgi:hypothetical protein
MTLVSNRLTRSHRLNLPLRRAAREDEAVAEVVVEVEVAAVVALTRRRRLLRISRRSALK